MVSFGAGDVDAFASAFAVGRLVGAAEAAGVVAGRAVLAIADVAVHVRSFDATGPVVLQRANAGAFAVRNVVARAFVGAAEFFRRRADRAGIVVDIALVAGFAGAALFMPFAFGADAKMILRQLITRRSAGNALTGRNAGVAGAFLVVFAIPVLFALNADIVQTVFHVHRMAVRVAGALFEFRFASSHGDDSAVAIIRRFTEFDGFG